MNAEDKKKIIAYLSGPRNYAEGVQLYDKYGYNRMFKRRFTLEDTEFSRQLLNEELRKLAGLSEAEFNRLPRLAKQKTAAKTERKFEKTNLNAEAPETVKKMIRFRDKFSFLNEPSCPDVLKVLVNDMFAAYDRYVEAHNRLQELPDEDVAGSLKEAEIIIENYLANREIWEELEHYKATGQILGKAAKFRDLEQLDDGLCALTDLELVKKLSSARANQSKQRKALEKAEAEGKDTAKATANLATWTEIREAIEAELEHRKKK